MTGKPILILSGALDPIVPKANAETLVRQLGETALSSSIACCRRDTASGRPISA